MKKNEPKTKQQSAETVAPMDALPMEVIETPDTTSRTGADMARPADAPVTDPSGFPADGEGCESVTVIVIANHRDHPKYAQMVARSVKQNLIGVDGEILIMQREDGLPLTEDLRQFLLQVHTERIILMTDDMVMLNPSTIYEVGCRRAIATVAYSPTPMLMHKSALSGLLDYMKVELPYADVMIEYDRRIGRAVMPVLTRPWDKDNWLLPIISDNPAPEALRTWAKTQRFMFINRPKWPRSVVGLLEERFQL